MSLKSITDELSESVASLSFAPPVTHVYNPLEYARAPYDLYLNRYGGGHKEVMFFGMNPGPWGMAQTGIPFGEVESVRDWLGLEATVGEPPIIHPKRPVDGFNCRRREVSGARVWGWARAVFGTPERFFERCFVLNYCPLLFLEESGRGRTPNKLPKGERESLSVICDRALCRSVEVLKPRWVVGLGRYAERSAQRALAGYDCEVFGILHPSPASPAANKGWAERITTDLKSAEILSDIIR